MAIKNNIGKALVYLRHQRHLSQEQLAEMADISRAYLSHIENDTSTPSVLTAYQLAEALEVSVDFLLNFGSSYGLPDNIYDECSLWERSIINDIALAVRDTLKRNPYADPNN